ncbi:MAG: BamA/TamA family outer membrane protein [Oryzomonas sp.]|uniref:BamA/TamA family outer membrane protein n=1 Tax=Oryzomonas sp. TaxID=2855186 RepID=UPI002845B4B6|nr:BamA/TamA family outer membrane protein [Oryzomonas sp.]MDR3579552.1 BamA/TamA family outer membrane protein [Oryzomonas sp.]
MSKIRHIAGNSLIQFTFYLLFTLVLGGCTSYIQQEKVPNVFASYSSAIPVKLVTIPLPVIASSPNEGITGGALTALLFHNKNDEIDALVAPQVNYNANFGVTTTVYGAFYPTPDRNIEIDLSQSTKINDDYDFKLRDKTYFDKKLEVNLSTFVFSDGSARFFGFEAKSPQQQETNYTDKEVGFNLSAGYDIGRHYQVILGERYRDVEIEPGAVKGIPYIKDEFGKSAVPGINGFATHAERISLVYSTLDSAIAPTFGGFAKVTVEPAFKALGGTSNFRRYEVETKGFIPLDNASYISVFRLMYSQTQGHRVPFLEQSILGGEDTLRGYGRNRFIDNSFLLCNLEERIRLFRWEVFNVTADWELAPFIDLGAVMDTLDKARANDFEFNPGIGFRAIVRPNIIGRVDMGIGRDGPAIFVGLGYPF